MRQKAVVAVSDGAQDYGVRLYQHERESFSGLPQAAMRELLKFSALQMIFAKFLMHRWQNIRLRQKEKLKSNMKGALMSVSDKPLLKKRAIIETVNDELKNCILLLPEETIHTSTDR